MILPSVLSEASSLVANRERERMEERNDRKKNNKKCTEIIQTKGKEYKRNPKKENELQKTESAKRL